MQLFGMTDWSGGVSEVWGDLAADAGMPKLLLTHCGE